MRKLVRSPWLWITLGLFCCVCALSGPAPWIGDTLILGLFGWGSYLIARSKDMAIDRPGLTLAVTCLTGLLLGTHAFGHWLTPGRWSWRRTFGVVGVTLGGAVAGIAMVGITHQIVWTVTSKEPIVHRGGASSRTHSINNLKQQALAAHSYYVTFKRLPPGALFDAQGRGLHGWPTLLLPYLEEDRAFKAIDLTRPWNEPPNLEVMNTRINGYLDPQVEEPLPETGPMPSHYAANVHLLNAQPPPVNTIRDGASNTLMFGTAAGNFRPWGYPWSWRDPTLGLNNSPDGFGLPGASFTNFAFADGSARALRADISPAVLRALSTPNGGETIDPRELE